MRLKIITSPSHTTKSVLAFARVLARPTSLRNSIPIESIHKTIRNSAISCHYSSKSVAKRQPYSRSNRLAASQTCHRTPVGRTTRWPVTRSVMARGGGRGGRQGRGGREMSRPESISRVLSKLLRHDAREQGLTVMPGGWMKLEDVVSAHHLFSHHNICMRSILYGLTITILTSFS